MREADARPMAAGQSTRSRPDHQDAAQRMGPAGLHSHEQMRNMELNRPAARQRWVLCKIALDAAHQCIGQLLQVLVVVEPGFFVRIADERGLDQHAGDDGRLEHGEPACSTRGLCGFPTLPISPSMALPQFEAVVDLGRGAQSSMARCTVTSRVATFRPPIRSVWALRAFCTRTWRGTKKAA